MARPIVSVIIPTFNRARLVEQAVTSVLRQEGGHRFDVIVIDDGSTAATAEALAKFGTAIRYVRQDNAGLNPARNHGLRLAEGDYIALLDDDDVWLPFKTTAMLAALERFPAAGFVHSNFHIWKPEVDSRRSDGLRSWFPRPFGWEEIYTERASLGPRDHQVADVTELTIHAGDVYYWSLFAPMVLPSTAILRRSIVADATFPEVDSVGDWEFFARLSHRSQAVFVPIETTLNRSHEDPTRLTRTDPSARLRRRVAFYDRLWRRDAEFMRLHGTQVDAVQADCLRRLARLCIANGGQAAAREALLQLQRIDGQQRLSDVALWALARLPFASRGVAAVRAWRARIRPVS